MKNIAVFFDAENMPAKYVEMIFDCLNKDGAILVRRAYADWSLPAMSSWSELLKTYPIVTFHQFHNNAKEVIDKAIMMDAVELSINRPEIDTICIVASDKDYAPLVLKLREFGKTVIGIGERTKCKEILVKSCNEFMYVEDMIKLGDLNPDEKVSGHIESPEENDASLRAVLLEAFEITPLQNDSKTVLASSMGASVKSKHSDFNYRKYNASSFLEAVKRFPQDFKVFDNGGSPKTDYVQKIESDESSVVAHGIISRIIRNYGFIESEGKSYFFCSVDVAPDSRAKNWHKGQACTFEKEKEPKSDGESTTERNGKAKNVKLID